MRFKLFARSLMVGIGLLSLGLAGCGQPRGSEAEAKEQISTAQLSPSPTPTQATPTAPATPVRPPDVVYVPTPPEVVNEMLRLAKVKSTDLVYDLGSGDGRIVIAAAQKHGARGIGIDINPERVREANENAKKAGVSDRVEFRQQDLFETDFRNATVVTLYLLPHLNIKLRPKLLSELKPGTRIVSHAFDMGEWKPDQVVDVDGRMVYYWVVPKNPPANLR